MEWWRPKPDENPLTALWDSGLSLFKAILHITTPNYLPEKSRVRSYDSLAYFSSAWRIKFKLFSMTFNLDFFLFFSCLFFWGCSTIYPVLPLELPPVSEFCTVVKHLLLLECPSSDPLCALTEFWACIYQSFITLV